MTLPSQTSEDPHAEPPSAAPPSAAPPSAAPPGAAPQAMMEEDPGLLASLVHASPDVIVVHDSLQILFVNRRGLDSMGAASPAEVVGRPLWDFVPRDYHAVLQERVAVLLTSGRGVAPTVLPLVLADGTEMWGEITSAPIPYQGQMAVQTVVRDVTARKRTEEALTESERRYRSLFNGIPVGLYRSTPEGQLLDANDTLVRMLGYDDRAELLGTKSPSLYLDPRERERWIRDALESGVVQGREVRLRRRDGSALPVRLNTRLRSELGEQATFEGSLEDMTGTREAEALYRLLFETMAQGVVYQDAGGRVVSANPAAQRILGVSGGSLMGGEPDVQRLTFVRSDGSICPRDDFPAEVALRDGTAKTALLGLERPGSEGVRWIEIESIPLFRDGEDRPYQVFSTLADVTERRAKEEALRLSEQRFDRALAGSGLGLWDWDVVSGEIYMDDRWYIMLSYAPGAFELNFEEWAELVHPEDRRRVRREIQRHLDGESPKYEAELRLRTGTGSWRWVLDRGQVLERTEDGRPLRAAGTHTDIHDRKEAEAARRRSEERLAGIFRAAPLGITLSRVGDGVFLEVNDTFADALGFSPEEMLGRSSTQLGIWVDVEERRAAEQELRATGRIRGLSTRFRTRSGQLREVQLFTELIDMEGEACALSLHQDVTESRQLEEQLRQSQKMEAIGRLAGGIAHDFNNLLTVMTGHVTFLLEALAGADPRRTDAEAISESANRAKRLTRQLLAFSRQQVMDPQVVDLEEMVRTFEPLLRRLIGEDVLLDVRGAEQPVWVRVDLGQLEQVVLNLAVNARDAMPSGGHLRIETSCVEIAGGEAPGGVRAMPPGRYACLRVADSGTGMDEATRQRVFEPFFTTKPAGKGTGLGLSTVYGIIDQSGGFIGLDSRPGDGACFSIYLPTVGAGQPSDPGSGDGRAEPAGASGTETILLVEDEAAVRSLACRVLERGGYTVHAAEDGPAALRLMDELPSIDLLLTDVVMPGISGRELADRARERRPGLPIIFMSGYTSDEVVRHAGQRDGSAFLQKPFTPGELSTMAREVLDR